MLGDPRLVVLGAGPAGLTAAYALAKRGRSPLVLESEDCVGGLARTEVRDGFRFDLGGHRFFTKSSEVQQLWHEVLGDDLLVRPRLSRIYFDGRFIEYPLNAGDLVRKLGPRELARSLSSYLGGLRSRRAPVESLEDWVSQRFGRRLYEQFFESYTEKVWGVPGSEIRAEWAAQRIRGLSLGSAARAAVLGNGSRQIRSLIEEFHYPRLGPGQMWETMADQIDALGGEVRLGAAAEELHFESGRIAAVRAGGETIPTEAVISSVPLARLPALADPPPPEAVRQAAGRLRYRDFISVALVVADPEPFPDTWLYIHDSGVRVARIQNFRAWSPCLVPDERVSCLGLEYFCFQGDELWSLSDSELVALAASELAAIGLVGEAAVERGYVVRVPGAYPIYDLPHGDAVAILRGWTDGVENLQQVGRNGLHRYNNSDHSMLTALRAVDNLNGARHDIWSVNADSWYHEEEEEIISPETPYRETWERHVA